MDQILYFGEGNVMKVIKLTDIQGIKVGNAQNLKAATGCTVIICEKGATAGVDVRGGSPGTRETDLLNPVNLVQQIHAVMLSGGSAFGLDAASGAMQYLEENEVGFDVKVTKVPIVCSAVLFDLTCGDYKIRPDKKMGYEACQNATDKECPQGCIGAGTGATIGKILGLDHAMKSGLGTYCVQVGDLMVGAIVAVNCLGDVYDTEKGKLIGGVLDKDKKGLGCTEDIMENQYSTKGNLFSGNTTIGVIVTNANLNKCETNKLASMTHNGYGRAMRPAHTMFDGDTIFTMATGDVEADLNVVGLLAARVMEKAIVSAVESASSMCGFLAYTDLKSLDRK